VRAPRNTARLFFFEKVLKHDDPVSCLIWPYAKLPGGYGVIKLKGWRVNQYVHRLVCEHANGPPPAGLYAAHCCGNASCVNPYHLRWATPRENQMDRHAHGTIIRPDARGERNPSAKLTEAQVRWIRACGLSAVEVSKNLNVTTNLVWGIRRSMPIRLEPNDPNPARTRP